MVYIIQNLKQVFGSVIYSHEQTGRRAVVLIDEYDKPILDVLDTDSGLEDRHRNVLKGFYSVFKVADSHLQFVLLTGVTKFSQVSVFSGFNQPKDISMDARYETSATSGSVRAHLLTSSGCSPISRRT